MRLGGVFYQPYCRSPKNANVILRKVSSPATTIDPALPTAENADFVPSQILAIYSRKSAQESGIALSEVFLAVKRHIPLTEAEQVADPYREFGFVIAGGLFSPHFSPPEIVPVDDIVCLFAKTHFKHDTFVGIRSAIHVLPLIKVNHAALGCNDYAH